MGRRSGGLCRARRGRTIEATEAEPTFMADVIYYGIAFVFLGVCLLYVRAADRL